MVIVPREAVANPSSRAERSLDAEAVEWIHEDVGRYGRN
jgi:hypothetical protein